MALVICDPSGIQHPRPVLSACLQSHGYHCIPAVVTCCPNREVILVRKTNERAGHMTSLNFDTVVSHRAYRPRPSLSHAAPARKSSIPTCPRTSSQDFASAFSRQGRVICSGILMLLSRQQWLVDQLNLVRTGPEINLTKTGLMIPAVGSSGHIAQIILSTRSCDSGPTNGISFYAGREL